MTNSNPLLLMDFDGVFNPMAQMPWQAVWPDMTDSFFVEESGLRSAITYSPSVIEFFNDLSQYPVDIMWISTWFHQTEAISQALGLSTQWQWLGSENNQDSYDWWKTDVVDSLLDSSRRILWVDDEIPLHDTSREQLMFKANPETISYIRPTSYVGLTPDHLEEIERFAVG